MWGARVKWPRLSLNVSRRGRGVLRTIVTDVRGAVRKAMPSGDNRRLPVGAPRATCEPGGEGGSLTARRQNVALTDPGERCEFGVVRV